MSKKVRWGVLGVAKIAVVKVIPAMQKGKWSEITAIASRDEDKARKAAADLGIPKAYGSYEALLADPDVDAIYNPLPNHMHVEWSIKAAQAGKHVLCEKPIAMNVEECRQLIDARDSSGAKIGEAFMVRTHPQWLRAREIVRSGEIGEVRAIMTNFSYSNRDPKNIRNIPEYGGGALMDIGCYAITTSRFIYDEEPKRVLSLVELDPDMGTDRLASAILDFPSGQAVFTCATQLVPYQRTQILGTRGRIEIVVPFNAPPDRACELYVDNGADLFAGSARKEQFPVCDQYTIQGDCFSRAILDNTEVPVSLENAIANMAVIDALFRAGRSGQWEVPSV
jgi:predicted dehydrogenase